MKVLSIAGVFFGGILSVKGHSWVECTQYNAEIEGQDYDSGSCNGYPRNWETYGSSEFGQDRGANYQPGGEAATDWCNSGTAPISTPSDYSGSYTETYPMASYTTGSTVRVVWPAKNHANYECFGNIPDFAMKIFVNPNTNPTSDLTSLSDWSLLIDWHVEDGTSGTTTGLDGRPFTNCPKFCDNTDRAVCYGDMTIDADKFSSSGVYTFMWYWAFNGDGDIYSMCWEAYVEVGGTVTNIEDDDDNNDDGSSSGTGEYLVQIPICYSGKDYDETNVLTAAQSLYPDLEWTVLSDVSTGNSVFNATLQTHTNNAPADITSSASNDDHEFCGEIVTNYGSDATDSCSSCSDVLVFTDGVTSTTEDDSGSMLIAVVIVLIIVVLIIAAGVGYQKLQEKRGINSANAQPNKPPPPQTMATQINNPNGQTNTQAISPVKD